MSSELLGEGATDGEILQTVQAWVSANPELTANPDLIIAGQTLNVPELES